MSKTYVRGTLSRTERKLDHSDGSIRKLLQEAKRKERAEREAFWAVVGDLEHF